MTPSSLSRACVPGQCRAIAVDVAPVAGIVWPFELMGQLATYRMSACARGTEANLRGCGGQVEQRRQLSAKTSFDTFCHMFCTLELLGANILTNRVAHQ